MSKKKIIIIVSGLIVLIAIVFTLIVIHNQGSHSEKKRGGNEPISVIGNHELLSCETREDIEAYVERNGLKLIYEEEYGYIYAVTLFQSLADVKVIFNERDIKNMSAQISLLEIPYPIENVMDVDKDVEFEYIPHDFTLEEKKSAQDAFDTVKYLFQEYLQCGDLAQYDIVQVYPENEDDVVEMSEEEQFYKGYTMREYSVKDAKGVIWLLRFSASEYNASASITKVIDTTEFEGFIPIIDMTKNK